MVMLTLISQLWQCLLEKLTSLYLNFLGRYSELCKSSFILNFCPLILASIGGFFLQLLLWCLRNGDFLFLSSLLYLLVKILLQVRAAASPFLVDYVGMDPWIFILPYELKPNTSNTTTFCVAQITLALAMKSPSGWLLYSCVSRLFPPHPHLLFKYFLTLRRQLFQTHLVSSYAIHGINHFSKQHWFLLLDNGVKIWAIGMLTATGIFLGSLNRARKYMCIY